MLVCSELCWCILKLHSEWLIYRLDLSARHQLSLYRSLAKNVHGTKTIYVCWEIDLLRGLVHKKCVFVAYGSATYSGDTVSRHSTESDGSPVDIRDTRDIVMARSARYNIDRRNLYP